MEYLVDIDEEVIRIKDEEGFVRTVSKNGFEEFLEKSKKEKIYLCSNNEEMNTYIRRSFINVKILDQNMYKEILHTVTDEILKKKPQQIMAANAVFHEYGPDVIIVDFENLLTIDTYNQQNYVSGVIYPGLDMHFNELNNYGYKNIKFNYVNSEEVVSTANQIGKGIINGYIGAIKELIDGEIQHFPWIMDIVFTGRRINNFINYLDEQKENLNFQFQYEENLIFKGMKYYVDSLENKKQD